MKNKNNDIKIDWINKLRPLIRKCLREIQNSLTNQTSSEITAIKPDGDPTTIADLLAENIVAEQLKKLDFPFKLYSEEKGYIIDRPEAKFTILLDPIDGTFFAIRGIPGGCIGISVHEASTMNPIAAILGDYYNTDLYWASAEGAFHNNKPIHVSGTKDINKAFISTCYGKYSRFGKMLNRVGIVEGAQWIETTGSMLSMVRVATGQIDAYFDLMLGYKSYDFAPGAYIAKMAGAIVTDEEGNELHFPYDLDVRCKFIIASSRPLHEFILNHYNK